MKNLTKKICAVITLVAMLATLCITAFADGGATVTIDDYEWSEITNGVAVITVTYTVTGDTVGALGATMLTFADADDSTTLDETDYNDTMQIVGIDQGAPKVLDGDVVVSAEADDNGAYAAGTYVFRFPVAVSSTETSEAGIQLGSGEAAAILIGGDNVTNPAALLITAPYAAWNVDSLEWTGADSIALGDITVYTEEEEAWLEAVAEAALDSIADDTITAYKADGVTNDTIALEGLDLTAVAVAGDGNYTVTVTVPAGTATDNAETVGGILEVDKTFTITVTANKIVELPVWEAGEPTLEGGTTINVEVEDIESGTLAADVKAALVEALTGKKITFPVTKEGEEPTSVDVIFEDTMLSDAVVTEGAYTATITVPAGEISADPEVVLDEDVVIAISGAVTEEFAGIYGDVNGDSQVTFTDAQLTAAYAIVGSVSGTFNEVLADVDGTPGITFTDAQLIAKKAVDETFQFPIELQ